MEGEALIQTLIRRLLVHGMCDFENEIKTTVRDYIADFFNAHLFKAFLYNYSALSQTEHEPLLNLRCGNVNRPCRHSERSVRIP